MIGVHVEFRIKPDKVPYFLRWKALEGELQRVAPGFIKRQLSQSRDDPTLFWYVSYWRTIEQMHAFAATPEFDAAAKASGMQKGDGESILTYVTQVFDEVGDNPNG